jgi:dienelactone hydrolase
MKAGGLPRGMAAVTALACILAGPASAYDPAEERDNYSKINERFQHDQANAEYQAELRSRSMSNFVEVVEEDLTDSERKRLNLCSTRFDGCAGDARLYDWGEEYGTFREISYVNRNGAVIEGGLWAPHTKKKRKLPGVVITTGSIQAPENLYWWAAQTLAQRGYLVMTFDVQGQGRSDTFGAGPDMFRGVPAQQAANFVEGTEEALDFFLSTKGSQYIPRDEDAVPKQESRVERERADAHNPLWKMLDRRRIGIAGHSLGAYAVSEVGSRDRRVDAIVAWDNLRRGGNETSGAGETPPITPRVPALGMSADYGLTPTPYTSDPDPEARNSAFQHWKDSGVDTMQLNIRGGTHYEWSYISNPAFGATLRGMDMAAWYTGAWFDKYVKRDGSADRRLLTNRWHGDARSAEIDPAGDGNLFSFYLRSRIAITGAGGAKLVCDDVREGCPALVERSTDGFAGEYSYEEARKEP